MFNKAPRKDVHSCDVRPPASKPKYIDALNKESTDTDYVIPVKKDPTTGLLYAPEKTFVSEEELEKVVEEVTKRIDDLEDATNDLPSSSQVNKIEGDVEIIQGNVGTVVGKIEDLEIDLSSIDGKIAQEASDRVVEDSKLQSQIDRLENNKATKNEVQAAQSTANNANAKASANEKALEDKLNKVFNVSDANDIAEEDYFIINSGGNAYRITLAQLKGKIGNEGETVVNNYLGDFNSEEELKAAYPVSQEGNFAYVKGDDEIYAMYLWVDEDDKSGWYKSTSGKYVKTTTFDSFKEQLQNGTFNIGAIDEKTTYNNSTPTPQALGGIPKGTKFTNKPITEVLDMLLYPYVSFSVGCSTSPSNGGTFEVGTTQKITGANVNITLGSASISKIELYHGSTLLGTKTSGITSGNNSFNVDISITSSTSTKYLTAKVTDSTAQTKSANSNSFSFVYPYYYGVISASDTLSESLVKGLTKQVVSKGTKTYSYTMNQQKAVIAYPAGHGNIAKILDENSFNVTETFTKNTLTINSVSYYVYVLNDVNTTTMKYTFSY